MNDPLNIERPGGLRNAVYGMMGSMVIFLVTIIWYGSQLEARIEARLDNVERQQTISATVIDKLNDAREEARVHSTEVDGQLKDVSGKLSVVLEMLQQGSDPQAGGTPNGGPENFQHQPTSHPH
jgi:uncharacterized coiled-coil protein SlyX